MRALEGLRVLELSGPLGGYCGKLFVDLGADVILVEPPGGSPMRTDPPLDDRGRSLPFIYTNSGKRSVVIDVDSNPMALLDLARTADLLVESQAPGTMGSRGIGYPDLRAVNGRLVMTSVTPFGQSGPYASRGGDDLLTEALGGLLYLGGYPDSRPIRPAGEQAVVAANLFAAVASMLALTHAELTGHGQHVDVAMMDAVVMGLENAPQYYDLEGVVRRRNGGVRRLAGTGTFACRDGYVSLLATGFGGTQHWLKLVAWLESELCHQLPDLHGDEWSEVAHLSAEAAKTTFADVFEPFCRARTKTELYESGQRWRVPICPINSSRDVLGDRQLLFREAFVDLAEGIRVPGAPYRLSATPWQVTGPVPTVGQHQHEVLAVLG